MRVAVKTRLCRPLCLLGKVCTTIFPGRGAVRGVVCTSIATRHRGGTGDDRRGQRSGGARIGALKKRGHRRAREGMRSKILSCAANALVVRLSRWRWGGRSAGGSGIANGAASALSAGKPMAENAVPFAARSRRRRSWQCGLWAARRRARVRGGWAFWSGRGWSAGSGIRGGWTCALCTIGRGRRGQLRRGCSRRMRLRSPLEYSTRGVQRIITAVL